MAHRGWLLSEAVRVAGLGCAWLPDGGRAGWLWAGWVRCLAVAAVRGCGYGGCEPGRMPGGWVLSKIAVAGALEGWPRGRVHGCDVAPARLAGWLTG